MTRSVEGAWAASAEEEEEVCILRLTTPCSVAVAAVEAWVVTTHEPRQARDTTLLAPETGRRIYVMGRDSLGEAGARRIRLEGLGVVISSKGCMVLLRFWGFGALGGDD